MNTLRLQRVSDAKRFYEILHNPNFTYFNVLPKTLEEQKDAIRENFVRRRNNTAWYYSILSNDELVGAIGVKINYHRKYIGEIGYFLDEKYWNTGIVSEAVKLIEDICFKKLKLTRLEILTQAENIGSEKVAIKNNYLKEGLLRKVIKGKDGEMKDCILYAKVL